MEDELPSPVDVEYVDFDTVANLKEPLIAKAAERLLLSHGELRTQYDCFKKNPNISGKIFLYINFQTMFFLAFCINLFVNSIHTYSQHKVNGILLLRT
uniref:Uncharacterized protein n=1 Tax=Arundo donax TaxID=35708 RepID=A0A0A9D5B8_ARUDO